MSTTSHTLRVHSPALPLFGGNPLLHTVRLSGREGLNSLFEYELLLATPEDLVPGARADACANIDLDSLIGQLIACEIAALAALITPRPMRGRPVPRSAGCGPSMRTTASASIPDPM
ncbi:hypothetical protein [uncultured Pseudacidovorax sp.]|uniref:hypothetical protein n=1 Tax=uncultured Pseudacidovorax sp. TaxID=679313 RepID=UPI0025EFDFD2|nr:hypothetical protein [uncultured Pseudacidovorax sp.]